MKAKRQDGTKGSHFCFLPVAMTRNPRLRRTIPLKYLSMMVFTHEWAWLQELTRGFLFEHFRLSFCHNHDPWESKRQSRRIWMVLLFPRNRSPLMDSIIAQYYYVALVSPWGCGVLTRTLKFHSIEELVEWIKHVDPMFSQCLVAWKIVNWTSAPSSTLLIS